MRVFTYGILAGLLALFATASVRAEEAPAPEDAFAILGRVADSYYDLERSDLRRAACYVRSNEILKTFDATARRIIQRTQFEAILEPGHAVQVKTRRIAPEFGAEARAGIERYRFHAQSALNRVFKKLGAVGIALQPDKLKHGFTGSVEADGKDKKLVFARKQAATTRRRRQARSPALETITVWVSASDTLERIEIAGGRGKTVMKIKVQKHKKQWAVKTLDVAKYDDRDRLDERGVSEVKYTTEKGILLPSTITLKNVDEKGKLLERRNEPNPVSIEFNKYEVETKG